MRAGLAAWVLCREMTSSWLSTGVDARAYIEFGVS
jgi:hypothetical protein